MLRQFDIGTLARLGTWLVGCRSFLGCPRSGIRSAAFSHNHGHKRSLVRQTDRRMLLGVAANALD
jgi:hypothetical protein